MLNGLDLFSGIGGITLALADYVRPAAYCENDRHAQSVLLSRMAKGDLPIAPIWDDVRTLTGAMLPPIDIISGGFPCQDISVAGRGEGLEGKRSILFFEIARLISELRPQFVFLENVPAITLRGLERIAMEFVSLRYDCRWGILSAADMGAPHLRERWFLLAHANGSKLRDESGRLDGTNGKGESLSRDDGEKESLAYSETMHGQAIERNESLGILQEIQIRDSVSDGGREGRTQSQIRRWKTDPFGSSWWNVEPDVGRMADGVSSRVDRLRGLGNSVVPKTAREAFERLMGIKKSFQ